MVSEAKLMHDVECREHRGSEVIELLRSSPIVSIWKQGEDNSKRIVALLFEKLKPDFNEMNTFSYLYDMPMEKEYFKNYRGFEGVVLKIDGSINYTPIKLSEVLSEQF